VDIALDADGLAVNVSDDGVGFDPAGIRNSAHVQSCFGLFSIRERARSFGGSMTIGNREAGGTELLVKLFCGTPGAPQ